MAATPESSQPHGAIPSPSAGSTESERYLALLCRKAFLSFWAYPNLYTDEGRHHNGVGNELCDLLVAFGNDVLLFSDKHCQYKDTGNAAVDWPRWYRRAIVKSVDQLYGAEKWLREHPDRVYLDKHSKHRFPIPLPLPGEANYHRIAVTRGSANACHRFYGGNSSSSLLITNELTGPNANTSPFFVGQIRAGKPFVHVLDETTLDILMGELDTAADFVAYLKKKETFLTKPGRHVVATGEEQLLAIYLTKQNKAGEHDIVLPDEYQNYSGISFDEGFWEDIRLNPQYLAKKEADKISYVWDELIEKFIKVGNPQLLRIPLTEGKTQLDVEPGLRVMASETRFRRRYLGEMFVGMVREMPHGKTYMRFLPSQHNQAQAYVFVAVPRNIMPSYEEYREARFGLLLAYCKVARLKDRNAKGIVGIAFDNDAPHFKTMSEDFIYLDYSAWGDAEEAEAVELRRRLGILDDSKLKAHHGRWKEWPDVSNPKLPTYVPPSMNRAQRRAEAKKRRK
jgi:hypothetical protein